MGLCLCKDSSDNSSLSSSNCCDCKLSSCRRCCIKWSTKRSRRGFFVSRRRRSDGHGSSNSGQGVHGGGHGGDGDSSIVSDANYIITPEIIDDLVLQTLCKLRTLVGNDSEAPPSMIKLHNIAENENGWVLVVLSLVNSIPIGDPLGPAVISLLLDDCPLPTKNNAMELSKNLDLLNNRSKYDDRQRRNICIILGCLAEKLAGQNSTILLNLDVLNFLLSNLDDKTNSSVILHSIIALEKFAQTSENKTAINKILKSYNEGIGAGDGINNNNPLRKLEIWANEEKFDKRQIGYCAQFSLDNIFLDEDRDFSYENVDNEGVNVILNSYDTSEYLKISPDGLEARCDSASFESVRNTFQVDSGIWYYEVLIITEGVMQIGWATKASKFLNHDGYGIGDDEFSVAVDLCRQVMWFNAQSINLDISCWKPGDILGSILDLDKLEIIFYLNGKFIQSHTEVFKCAKSGFFSAGSFMSFQQCRFNFGSQPFKYPPNDKKFQNFNEYAKLGDEVRIVLPRHLKMEYLRKVSVKENSCNLCFDHLANVRLMPCEHCGFCNNCADQLDNCPLCRHIIENKITLFDSITFEQQ